MDIEQFNPAALTVPQLGYGVAIFAVVIVVFMVFTDGRRRFNGAQARPFITRPPADLSELCICTFINGGVNPCCPCCNGTGKRSPREFRNFNDGDAA